MESKHGELGLRNQTNKLFNFDNNFCTTPRTLVFQPPKMFLVNN